MTLIKNVALYVSIILMTIAIIAAYHNEEIASWVKIVLSAATATYFGLDYITKVWKG